MERGKLRQKIGKDFEALKDFEVFIDRQPKNP